MLELVSTRVETSGKLESKCGKSLDTQILSAPPSSSTVAPTPRSPLSIAAKRIPVIRMPIAAVDVIRPHKGADRAVLLDAAVEFLTGEVDVVDRQHRRHLQLVRTVLHEIVQPVVVGPANRGRELRVHIVP